jgi:small subunit ribosomal protein S20
MANIKSQIKRNRQNETARQRNIVVRSRTRTFVRRFRSAIDEGDVATAETVYAEAARELDKAAQKGVIHRNQAANRKSGWRRHCRPCARADRPAPRDGPARRGRFRSCPQVRRVAAPGRSSVARRGRVERCTGCARGRELDDGDVHQHVVGKVAALERHVEAREPVMAPGELPGRNAWAERRRWPSRPRRDADVARLRTGACLQQLSQPEREGTDDAQRRLP